MRIKDPGVAKLALPLFLNMAPVFFALVIAANDGFWPVVFNGIDSTESTTSHPPGHAIAFVLTGWEYVADGAAHTIPDLFLNLERFRCRSQRTYGHLIYPIKALAKFQEPFKLDSDVRAYDIMQ